MPAQVCTCIQGWMSACLHVSLNNQVPDSCVCVCMHLCACVCECRDLGMERAGGWWAPGCRRESDRQALLQPPAPRACFPACGSCEPVNSSYINSCCLFPYCRERRSWPLRGTALRAAPPPTSTRALPSKKRAPDSFNSGRPLPSTLFWPV